jgi:glutamate-ammonia-ligase adenylyltransferase
LAEAVVSALWPVVVADFARKHGAMPGRGGALIAMGSLGVRRLTATSDLDLIMVYDASGVEASDGRRPLAARPYFARLTQSLVTALTAPMAEGRLYEVDMRLRPSGRQGPVATSLDAFKDYQEHQAWTWEHLALTRARVIAGQSDLTNEIEVFRQSLLRQNPHGASVLSDVADMRGRIAGAKTALSDGEAKIGAGRLQDIELFSQSVALICGSEERALSAQLQSGVADGWLDAADAQALCDAAGFFWKLQTASRLITGEAIALDKYNEGARRLILRETDYASIDDVQLAMQAYANDANAIISRKLVTH